MTGRPYTLLDSCTGDACNFSAGSAHWVYKDNPNTTYEVPPLACPPPEGIRNAAKQPCAEGLAVAHGGVCTAQCLGRFAPTVQRLGCAFGTLSPAAFECLPSNRANEPLCSHAVGNPASGIACQDDNAGVGFIMFSAVRVSVRFHLEPPHPSNADHFICVRFSNGAWQYDTNYAWRPFAPLPTDLLAAAVNFDADTAVSLAGSQEAYHGIAGGFAGGNLSFRPNRWEGRENPGEFSVSGTAFSAPCPRGPGGSAAVPAWVADAWGPCSSSCGEGGRNRSVFCSSDAPAACASGDMPPDFVACEDFTGCGSASSDCRLEGGMSCDMQWWTVFGFAVLLAASVVLCAVRQGWCCYGRRKLLARGQTGSSASPRNSDSVVKPGVFEEETCCGALGTHQEVMRSPSVEVDEPPDYMRAVGHRRDERDVSVVMQDFDEHSLARMAQPRHLPDPRPEAAGQRAHLPGTWFYGNEGAFYRITEPSEPDEAEALRYNEQLLRGPPLSGILRPEQSWFQGDLYDAEDGGRALGTIRLRFVKEREYVLSNFKEPHESMWGPDTLAYRTEAPRPQVSRLSDSPDQPQSLGSRGLPPAPSPLLGPRQLCVMSPNAQVSCTGIYRMVAGELPGGLPLWKKQGANRWLYSGADGKWYIGGKSSKERNFGCSAGYIFCDELHRGTLPHLQRCAWQWGDGSSWYEDGGIRVVELGALPPEEAADGDGDSQGEEEEDRPGIYVVVHDNTAVTTAAVASPPFITHLMGGTVVEVLEVAHRQEEGRVRGRLAEPLGWISIASTEDGYRWACRCSGSQRDSHPQAAVLPGCHATESRRHSRAGAATGPPHELQVHSPHGQQECSGVFALVPGQRANGQPLWQQARGEHWLYSGTNGKWCIGSPDTKEKNFQSSAGWLYQLAPHRGALPHEAPANWGRWTGSKFQEDPAITVSAVEMGSAHSPLRVGDLDTPISKAPPQPAASSIHAVNWSPPWNRAMQTSPPSAASTPFRDGAPFGHDVPEVEVEDDGASWHPPASELSPRDLRGYEAYSLDGEGRRVL